MRADDAVTTAARLLSKSGVESPLLDAQLIMARVIGQPRIYVVAHPEYELTARQAREFDALITRRATRCPLAYILGSREFYGIEIVVEPGVLVPRPETEVLVEECLKRLNAVPEPAVADIGVGSGAIAVAVAANLPEARVWGTEISTIALKVARVNVEKQHLSERVTIAEGDLLGPLEGMRFDAIVSNPPYIPTAEIDRLQPEVSVYEPRQALDGGPDGLDAYRSLLPGAFPVLREGGFAAVEIGAGQAEAVRRIASEAGFGRIETVRDLAKIERVVVACR